MVVEQHHSDLGFGRVAGVQLSEGTRRTPDCDGGRRWLCAHGRDQVQARHQREGAVALVLVSAANDGVSSRRRAQIGGRVGDGLDSRLLIVGDERRQWRVEPIGLRAQKFDLLVDEQDLGHL